MTPRLLVVVGARPNFVKVAPVYHALRRQSVVDMTLVHTGQHYDRALSDAFLEQLELPEPAHYLGIGSGSHAQQTASVLVGIERVLTDSPHCAVLVAGDVNSTMAAALAAAKLGVTVIHLESGLRSRDWTMPEEVNRVVTDRISDLLLCPSADAVENLAAEGIFGENVELVGNTMIDTLFQLLETARGSAVLDRLSLRQEEYVLVTLHRPGVVDDAKRLAAVLDVLGDLSAELPVVFPLHPRTRARIESLAGGAGSLVTFLEPLDYFEFIAAEASARLVITDSGGVQEETSALGVPCLTYRDTTERPITTSLGTNRLVGVDPEALREAAFEVLANRRRVVREPIPLWDGAAGSRAADSIAMLLAGDRHPQWLRSASEQRPEPRDERRPLEARRRLGG